MTSHPAVLAQLRITSLSSRGQRTVMCDDEREEEEG